MNNIRTFLEKAKSAISEIYNNDAADIRLEEFDKNKNQIVVSYLLPDNNPSQGMAAITFGGKTYERIYKIIVFDNDGEVESISIFDI